MEPENKVSENELDVLRAAAMILTVYGFSPATCDILRLTSLKSRGNAQQMIHSLAARGLLQVEMKPRLRITAVNYKLDFPQRALFLPGCLWYGINDLAGNHKDFLFVTRKDDKLFQVWKRTDKANKGDYCVLITPKGVKHDFYSGDSYVYAVLIGEYNRV